MNTETASTVVMISCGLFAGILLMHAAQMLTQAQEHSRALETEVYDLSVRSAQCYDYVMRVNSSDVGKVMTLLEKYARQEYINATEAAARGVEPYMCGEKSCGFSREARDMGLRMGWARWENESDPIGTAHATAVWVFFPDPTSGGFFNESGWELDSARLVDGSYWGEGRYMPLWGVEACD